MHMHMNVHEVQDKSLSHALRVCCMCAACVLQVSAPNGQTSASSAAELNIKKAAFWYDRKPTHMQLSMRAMHLPCTYHALTMDCN